MGTMFNFRPRPGSRFPVAAGDRPERPYVHMNPRAAAIELLRDHIESGKAGLDPYDETVFLLDAHANEVRWAYRSLELTGLVLDQRPWRMDGTVRFRATLKEDVRVELGLDAVDAPVMADEPLASRGVAHLQPAPTPLDVAIDLVRDHCELMSYPTTDGTSAVEISNDSPAMAALDRAHQAWHERSVH